VEELKYSTEQTSLLPFVSLLYRVSAEFVKWFMDYMEMPIHGLKQSGIVYGSLRLKWKVLYRISPDAVALFVGYTE
jgi:hypothetical protein